VVYMLAVEQGLLPHERSLARDDEVEEERRLCFVGITRAKEELYLCHAKLREFRGQSLYAVPSMFLEELPSQGVECIDLAVKPGLTAADLYRGGGNRAADEAWADTGMTPRGREPVDASGFGVGVTVLHAEYGRGRIIDVSGYGAMRRLKVRFATAGDRTFVADRAKLTVVRGG
jgi:DNA helicase-2/ATP-dependent DNA helicase PcrA